MIPEVWSTSIVYIRFRRLVASEKQTCMYGSVSTILIRQRKLACAMQMQFTSAANKARHVNRSLVWSSRWSKWGGLPPSSGGLYVTLVLLLVQWAGGDSCSSGSSSIWRLEPNAEPACVHTPGLAAKDPSGVTLRNILRRSW